MFLGMDFSTVIIFFKNSLFYSHYKVFFFKLFYTTLFMYWKNITRYDMHSEFKLWVGGGGGGGSYMGLQTAESSLLQILSICS